MLSPPSISSAYCRIYRLADETVDEDGKKAKKYDDITISSGIEVIVLTLPDTDAAPARPAPR